MISRAWGVDFMETSLLPYERVTGMVTLPSNATATITKMADPPEKGLFSGAGWEKRLE